MLKEKTCFFRFHWQGNFKSFVNIHLNWINMTYGMKSIRCRIKKMKIRIKTYSFLTGQKQSQQCGEAWQ